MLSRSVNAVIAVACTAALVTACGSSSSEDSGVATVTAFETAGRASSSSTESVAKQTTGRSGECRAPVIAIDPGHNPVEIAEFDPVTGVAMRDYSNGAEDRDTMAVSLKVKRSLESAGYKVVLLKKSVSESVTYRERVTRAEKAGADIGVSVHTYTDDHRVFPQRVGLYREGIGADGKPLRVVFQNAETARKSLTYSTAIAKARSIVEGQQVVVADNSFDGRAPLWSGNIPMIALISEKIPWAYNEFGIPGGGGSAPIGDAGIAAYADGLTKGIEAALPNNCDR